ncbi:Hypothetical_protein [Hexamita inflata]|uniref:Hypothetical_protein n=1 Tax=Hexamita inflata TaxID=28002 RepID=A0AA86PKZ0_9EUKA|nr:Hypothetical protein HINF_LOCUS24714 [Hexamita inflata]
MIFDPSPLNSLIQLCNVNLSDNQITSLQLLKIAPKVIHLSENFLDSNSFGSQFTSNLAQIRFQYKMQVIYAQNDINIQMILSNHQVLDKIKQLKINAQMHIQKALNTIIDLSSQIVSIIGFLQQYQCDNQ